MKRNTLIGIFIIIFILFIFYIFRIGNIYKINEKERLIIENSIDSLNKEIVKYDSLLRINERELHEINKKLQSNNLQILKLNEKFKNKINRVDSMSVNDINIYFTERYER